MGTSAERAEQRGDLRERIIEAARDIVSEQGLDALSMRALALRIGYSPATIYLSFRDKDELLRSVMAEGFSRLDSAMERELIGLPEDASPMEKLAATGRAYARFALENTGYFRTMYKMPRVANLEMCPPPPEGMPEGREESRQFYVALVRDAVEAGEMVAPEPDRAALIGWGVMHGLTSLYLSGHLADQVESHDEFMDLIETAIGTLAAGWEPR